MISIERNKKIQKKSKTEEDYLLVILESPMVIHHSNENIYFEKVLI